MPLVAGKARSENEQTDHGISPGVRTREDNDCRNLEIPIAGAGFGWSSILVAVFAQHLPASATPRLTTDPSILRGRQRKAALKPKGKGLRDVFA